MSRPRRRRLRIRVAVAAAPAAQLALLAGLLRGRPAGIDPTRLRSATGEDLLVLTAWALAVAVALWLLLGTLACVVSHCWRGPTPSGVLCRLAPTVIRRAVEAAFATSVVLAPAGLTGTAFAAPAPPGPLPVHAGVVVSDADEPVVRGPDPPPSTSTTATSSPTTTPGVAAVPAPVPPETPTPRTRVVVAGDNLWAIARAELASAGAPADVESVARYWRTLLEHNRTTLRSGNPNLIYPGELVTVPPVPAR